MKKVQKDIYLKVDKALIGLDVCLNAQGVLIMEIEKINSEIKEMSFNIENFEKTKN